MKRVYTPVPHQCVRCWHCCLDAEGHEPNETLTKLLALPWYILEGVPLRMCPFLMVDDEGKPHCSIYHDRPLVCRLYYCEVRENYEVQPLRRQLRGFEQHVAHQPRI